ncbi:hypothetical protein [Miniphocaeibacter massiliensis]|uniref:hypothetical protein n=1 Tax=Miniphocaeibacter massiliensis TaxID=2041841 RepID=UPI000C06FCCB|nr:hypothetical protein [Miniphocaeibacter massiliensis]
MKKIRVLFVFFVLVMLSSCTDASIKENENFIQSPKSNDLSIEGTWKVIDKKSLKDTSKGDTNPFEEIYITKNLVEIGNRYNLYPEFESEYVSTSNYLKNKELGIQAKDITDKDFIEVVLVSGRTQFSLDIVKISNEKIFLINEGYQYFLEKKSDSVDGDILDKYKEERKEGENLESYDGKIGLSLVVKCQSKNTDDNKVKTEYNSYYLHYDNTNYKRHGKVYFANNIYVPKSDNNEIYKYNEDWESDKHEAYFMRINPNTKFETDKEEILYESEEPFELNYISDQYYSISFNDKTTTSRKFYRIYSIDNDFKSKALSATDIDSKNGKKILEDVINTAKEKDELNIDKNSPMENYTNIGIVRVDGLWKFRTSLVLGNNNNTIKEIDVSLTPKKDFFRNNTLGKYKWADIKEEYSNLVDAYISPEENFIIINNSESISLYSITDLKKPIITLPRKEGDCSIIMSKWTVGNEADVFIDKFIKDNKETLKIY